mmetsp:Transcript_15733/g.18194  ORF Transcript_15733/g.18194 Transcript_15733/m.18194 type:complete len:129 (-) Transcript_15733:1821-2207(-)
MDDRKIAKVALTDAKSTHFFDHDFVLLFRNQDINRPTLLYQQLGGEFAILISMLADVSSPKIIKERTKHLEESEVDLNPKQKYQNELDFDLTPAAFYFLIDRSGSMDGNRIETAKESLRLILHGLPMD